MSKQPEALRLAEELESSNHGLGNRNPMVMRLDCCAELRRQHALIVEMRDALKSIDADLSRILHELAGSASLCWSPKPAGVFDSSTAIGFVEDSISEIRNPLRAALAKAEAQS